MDISSMIYFLCPKIIKTALSVSLSRFIITLGVLLPLTLTLTLTLPRAPCPTTFQATDGGNRGWYPCSWSSCR